MATKMRKPAVRFTLGALQKTTDLVQNVKDPNDNGRDSGAPSPDIISTLQPANVRLLHNQQRIKLLNAINEILHERAEHESSRTTLITLHDELKKKLRKKMEECFAIKKLNLIDAKANTKILEREKEQLVAQIEKLNAHLQQHAKEHEQHSHGDDIDAVTITQGTLSKAYGKRPSKKADQKLAAGRLLREVQQLRSRLAVLERRLIAETRRKRQAEEELSILKAALSRQRGKRIEKIILKPE